MDSVLRTALGAHLVEDVAAPPNYSVQMGETSGASAGFHFLYRSSASVIRTRDPHRLVRGLFTHLSSHADNESNGLVKMHGVTLVAGGVAVLAPPVLRQWPELVERRLNARGLRFADTPWALVDPERAEVVVPEPSLTVDWSALEALDTAVATPRRADPPVPAGRYPLSGWAFWVGTDHAGPLSRAHAVMLATQLAIGVEPDTVQSVLDGLAAVARTVEPAGISWRQPADLVAPLAALV